jgi:Fe-Mn family superoxide dismutase
MTDSSRSSRIVEAGGPVHALPRLPYGFTDLEPHIDAQTMQIHYRKHHQAYVDSLNRALAAYPHLQSKSPESLCRALGCVPDEIRATVRHAAGGHWNHSRFWSWMTPHTGGAPFGKAAEMINASFGSLGAFKDQFSKAALGPFIGWTWLISEGGRLSVVTTVNQDNPLMEGKVTILGLDVWEHAYYLKHQNRRRDYIKAWWNVVNWAEVNRALTISIPPDNR